MVNSPMTTKELEKYNPLTWRKYTDAEKLEDANEKNYDVWDRLYSEYSSEIEVINKTKQLCESVS